MHCEGKSDLSYCLIEVVTKAGMTVFITLCRICCLIEVVTKAGMTVFITLCRI